MVQAAVPENVRFNLSGARQGRVQAIMRASNITRCRKQIWRYEVEVSARCQALKGRPLPCGAVLTSPETPFALTTKAGVFEK